MKVSGSLEKAKIYIERHSQESDVSHNKQIGPCITISRQAGAGSGIIAEKLIDLLKPNSKLSKEEWAIFDKNLIEKVIEDHKLPKQLAKFMGESEEPFLLQVMNEVFGIHPPLIKLQRKTTETILRIANKGNCIIIGRGANFITSYLKNCFHVRLVAPTELRIKNVQEIYGNTKQDAIDFVNSEDKKRNKFIEEHYHKDASNPIFYDLTINTGLLSIDETASIISSAVMAKFNKFFF